MKNKKGKGKHPMPVKGKGKDVSDTKAKANKDGNPSLKYFVFGVEGHWKWNCPKYLKELKSSSGIYMIEINYACTTSWDWIPDVVLIFERRTTTPQG